MSTLTGFNGLQVVTPDPTGAGGLAINNNFKALSTHVDTTDPTSSNDTTQGFSTGSRWYNYLSTSEWICRDATSGNAVWQIVSRTQSIATVATTAALPSNTYSNGSSGLGATLTGTSTGVLAVDSHTVALNDLVLVKNESTAENNGLYTCTTAGAVGVAYVLTRTGNMNSSGDFSGALVPVGTAGAANASTIWVANPSGTVTVGTTAIPFLQIGTASLTAGTGISISGGTISVVNGVYTTGSYSNPAWITSISASIVSGNISGSAANVTGVVAASNGGTGVANTNTITLGGNVVTAAALTTAGAYGITITATATTAVTLPTGGTLLSSTAATMASALNMGTNAINNVVNPTNPQDAATKNYVDATVQGLQVKSTATVATTAALPSNTYSNGSSGVGATLTAGATGTLTVDGHAVALNDLVLVKNESSSAHNGLYLSTTVGATGVAYVLTRASDMDVAADFPGAFVPVGNAGTANANSLWLANPSGTVTVGTTAIPFTQLNAATQLTAGANINISGNTISATPAGSNTQIQFDDSGVFGGASKLVYDKSTGNFGFYQQFENFSLSYPLQEGGGGFILPPTSASGTINYYTAPLPPASASATGYYGQIIIDPTSLNGTQQDGSGNYIADGSVNLNYYVAAYTYSTPGGIRYYSPGALTFNFTDDSDSNTFYVALSWPAAPVASGYVIWVTGYYNGNLYNYASIDVGNVTSYNDTGSGWGQTFAYPPASQLTYLASGQTIEYELYDYETVDGVYLFSTTNTLVTFVDNGSSQTPPTGLNLSYTIGSGSYASSNDYTHYYSIWTQYPDGGYSATALLGNITVPDLTVAAPPGFQATQNDSETGYTANGYTTSYLVIAYEYVPALGSYIFSSTVGGGVFTDDNSGNAYGVDLSWAAVPNVSGYIVYIDGGEYALAYYSQNVGNVTSFSDKATGWGTSYPFYINSFQDPYFLSAYQDEGYSGYTANGTNNMTYYFAVSWSTPIGTFLSPGTASVGFSDNDDANPFGVDLTWSQYNDATPAQQDKILSKYLKPELLVIDDMGMKQLPRRSGEYLLEIIMRRHENRSTMMTSNRPLEDWAKLIGDVPAATAILDRFLQHATIIQITGKSYRLRNAKGDGKHDTKDEATARQKGAGRKDSEGRPAADGEAVSPPKEASDGA